MSNSTNLYLVSACLVGFCTRYDGKTKASQVCLDLLHNTAWVPICPEQLGGLPTPREAADIINGNGDDVLAGRCQVVTKSGINVSEQFIKGANQVLLLAKSQRISGVFLKSGSPSCAVTGTSGVTASLLRQHGFSLKEF